MDRLDLVFGQSFLGGWFPRLWICSPRNLGKKGKKSILTNIFSDGLGSNTKQLFISSRVPRPWTLWPRCIKTRSPRTRCRKKKPQLRFETTVSTWCFEKKMGGSTKKTWSFGKLQTENCYTKWCTSLVFQCHGSVWVQYISWLVFKHVGSEHWTPQLKERALDT